ncbi:MAG TPA: helix-hairpin-helix domain-containing protein [Flavisolibacter sp.]|nr:helix-hairpin-helix domain-containing protein [Flavisolibacter sp.]
MLPKLFPSREETEIFKTAAIFKAIDTLNDRKPPENRYTANGKVLYATPDFKKGELFEFDPNNLDSTGWKRLGLGDRTIRMILHYRDKGGKFYKTADVQKIWGLPVGFYDRVKKYIVINNSSNNEEYKKSFQKNKKETENIDVNTADSAAFESLPGIGPVLAARIIKFRNKVGGFYCINQVKETYGISDSVFKIITPRLYVNSNELKLNKVNINTATKEQLKIHPYMRWTIGNAIIEYRNQHGTFVNLSDLKKISVITEDVYSKIAPYLSIQ